MLTGGMTPGPMADGVLGGGMLPIGAAGGMLTEGMSPAMSPGMLTGGMMSVATNSSSPFATKYNVGEMAAAAAVGKGNPQKMNSLSSKVPGAKVRSSNYRSMVC